MAGIGTVIPSVKKVNEVGAPVKESGNTMGSVLLQGLLLQSPDHWPAHLSPAFRDHHARWLEHLHEEGVSPLAGALRFVHDCEGVEAVLCGVVSRNELVEVLESWSQLKGSVSETPEKWVWEDLVDLDPRHWRPR